MSNITASTLPVGLTDLTIRPADRDHRLETWLALRCGLRLEPKGWPNRGLTAIATKASPDLSLAQRAVTESLKPATDSQLHGALATLSTQVTRSAEHNEMADDVLLATYVRRLKPYPADIVLWALEHWPDRAGVIEAKFWPAWAELKTMIEDAYAFRRGLLAALQDVRALPARETPPPSDADIAEVRARAAALVEQLNATTHRTIGPTLEPFRDRVAKHAEDRAARRAAALAALPGSR